MRSADALCDWNSGLVVTSFFFLGITSILLVLIHALLCSNNQKQFCGGINGESQ